MKVQGELEVICGSMFSGKSEELIRRIHRAQIAKIKIQTFKPALDNRFSKTDVVSHRRNSATAVCVADAREILELLQPDTQIVAIDEVHFFSDEIIGICDKLADKGLRVIVAGLDTDFRGEPFMIVAQLMARAEKVDKLRAICVVCGDDACRSQRMIDGKPAPYGDPTILVGAQEKYEARCRHCYELTAPEPVQKEELPLSY